MVFTMNPASDGFAGRCATSPALFNRCVVDWFGTWPTKALAQVCNLIYGHCCCGSRRGIPLEPWSWWFDLLLVFKRLLDSPILWLARACTALLGATWMPLA